MDEFARLFGSEARKREFLRYMRECFEEKGFTVEDAQVATPTGEQSCWKIIPKESESNLCPMINPESVYYNAGNVPIDDIVEDIVKEINARVNKPDEFVLENLRDDIRIMLRNPELNGGYLEQLNAIMVPFANLVMIPYILTDIGVSIPNKNVLKKWGVTAEEILSIGSKNMEEDVVFEPIESVLQKLFGDMGFQVPGMAQGCNMYVLSNAQKYYGAGSILTTTAVKRLEELADEWESDLWLIPSSIHEWLIAPKTEIGANNYDITNTIRSTNAGQMMPDEWLSDHPYCYEWKTGMITF